jgi:hypothetical protein
MARFSHVLVSALLIPAACSQVLGIEDAHVDNSLLDKPGASGSSNPASSGTSASAAGIGGEDSSPPVSGGASGGGTGGKGAAGEEPGAGGVPAGPELPSLCERYCDKVMTHCKGKYEQYRSFDQCVEVCKRLPSGEVGDQNVNTVECRIRQAGFAEREDFLYCKSAGPLGDDKCGSNCVSFCSLMQTACTAENTATNLEPSYFASSQECLEACGAIPVHADDPLSYSSSAPSSFIGNTLYCRTYHLAAGLEQDAPDEHCPHAMGGDPCIEP